MNADPERLAKYRERISRYGKAYLERAKQNPEKWGRINASKRAHMERAMADPEKRERLRRQMNDSKRRAYWAKSESERKRILKPKEEPKPEPVPEPKPVAMHSLNVRAFKKPIAKRGRPRKPKKNPVRVAMLACLHNNGFVFVRIEGGMRRTCKGCGKTFTEISRPLC